MNKKMRQGEKKNRKKKRERERENMGSTVRDSLGKGQVTEVEALDPRKPVGRGDEQQINRQFNPTGIPRYRHHRHGSSFCTVTICRAGEDTRYVPISKKT